MLSYQQKICRDPLPNKLSNILYTQKLAVIFIFSLFSATISQKDGDVKLVNGPTSHQGTVAVYKGNAWGTICDDSWSRSDSDVVCRQLGFERSAYAWHRAKYGRGPGLVLIDQIRCPYDADHILQCTPKISRWGIHDCTHSEDAGVDCVRKEPARRPYTMPVKLECPEFLQEGLCKSCSNKIANAPGECTNQTAVEGVVFAHYGDTWNPVSGETFGEEEAKVVCSELGYSWSYPNPPLSELWTNWDGQHLLGCIEVKEGGSGQQQQDLLVPYCSPDEVSSNNGFRKLLNTTLLKDLACTGSERRLLDCYLSEFGPHSGSGSNVATVRCGFKPHPSCSSKCEDPSTCQPSGEVYRLRGGLYPWTGRVEVRTSKGTWATVCSHGWDFPEANIVCRALGYGSANKSSSSHGRGVGEIAYSRLRCKGDEATLGDCTDKVTGYLAELCGHRFDAGVECAVPTVCSSGADEMAKLITIRNTRWPFYPNEFVSVKGPQGWGAVCADALNARAANVVCRSTRSLFGTRVRAASIAGSHTLYSGLMNCTGSEMSLAECNMSLVVQEKCEKKEAVVDCTGGLPDLVPDLRTLSSSIYYYPYINQVPMYLLQCALEEKCLSSSAYGPSQSEHRYLLRFSSLTMNWGTVDFQANQNQDSWQYHTCHRHYHSFESFIHYDLLHVSTGVKAAEGHKASFCLADSTCSDGGYARYGCSSTQGISPNCGDLYASHLDCQWIDVTDVPEGNYLLSLHVNPDHLVAESDYGNNEISCLIEIVDHAYYREMKPQPCQLSDH